MPKEIFRTIEQNTMNYTDGTGVAYTLRISHKRLGKLVWKASKNKSGTAVMGPLKVDAKVTQKGAEAPCQG